MGKKVLAFDFGASGGRAVMGEYNGEKLSLTELHRFSNDPVMLGGTFYWDFLRLFHDIKLGISKAVISGNKDIISLGIDTWGVDFGLLDNDGRKIRFLKNIIGLWLMQECRRQWQREGDSMSFADIDKLTIKAKSLERFINPDYAAFSVPGNMPARIAEYCRKTGQTPPQNKGEVARCITESLALKYRSIIEELENIRGRKIDVIHIIGGGVQDKLLCQYTANSTKKKVLAGPIEATALGNVAVQLISCGEFANIDECSSFR